MLTLCDLHIVVKGVRKTIATQIQETRLQATLHLSKEGSFSRRYFGPLHYLWLRIRFRLPVHLAEFRRNVRFVICVTYDSVDIILRGRAQTTSRRICDLNVLSFGIS